VPVTLNAKTGQIDLPVYLRKLDKRSHWGHSEDPSDSRTETAVAEVFHPSETAFSLFKAVNDEDLYRIVVGLNSLRASLSQQIDFVAFTESELLSAGITLSVTPGETTCHAANRLHVDGSASGDDSLRQLCHALFGANRAAFRVTKSEASEIAAHMQAFGCQAVITDSVCQCVDVQRL
jgi:hypothetical protein